MWRRFLRWLDQFDPVMRRWRDTERSDWMIRNGFYYHNGRVREHIPSWMIKKEERNHGNGNR
jgi:hypothetical protein